MANNKFTYQQVTNVSINKNKLVEIATNYHLSENDLRVVIVLFTELNGWRESEKRETKDPLNFKKIDLETIGDILDMKKKDVKKSIKHLINSDLIEEGDSDTVKNGYRFRF